MTPSPRALRPREGWRAAVRLAMLTVALLAVWVSPALGEEDDITCTIRIEFSDTLNEALATGPTSEEASDAALESACALMCVEPAKDDEKITPPPTGAAKQKDKKAPPPDDKASKKADDKTKAPPSEDGELVGDGPSAVDEGVSDAMEACIEKCAEEAIVIGTLCTDAAGETVFADGAYDPDAQDAP